MTDIRTLPTRLTLADGDRLAARLGRSLSKNTVKAYRQGWEAWRSWAAERGLSVCPAHPIHIAAFLDQYADGRGRSTVGLAKTAIAKMHQIAGHENPCRASVVADCFRVISRESPRPRQARALTAERLDRMAGVLTERDLALLRVMRDGLLRVSEACALAWGDIARKRDGSGLLFIDRSKTDPAGAGHHTYLSPQTMRALAALAPGEAEDLVFPLTPDHISRRIRTLAARAGLGAGYSGHSPRVGMAVDLARTGTGLTQLMQAGRWRSSVLVARYTEQIAASRNAVARYYHQEKTE